MLSSAIVVFREVFEIVLIVGIILAATKTMPNRNKAIMLGFGGGILGSALVAMFTDQISSFAEGMGQEYFNAGILLTAALFIGWTVLWMKKHARQMRKHFENISESVKNGKTPFIALSIVIALAILREGSEIVLFTYGMLASGASTASLISGSLIGMAGGLSLGLLLYFGLIKLSLKTFFSVTSGLLVLLVAGMMSQAFGFLSAAGAFETFSKVVWDSSAFISEDGIIGESLGTMIGYTARPTAIQLIVYISTLTILVIFMKLVDYNLTLKNLFKTGTATCLFIIVLASSPAHATKNVTSPYVEKGELEIEWKGEVTHDDENDEQDGAWKQKASIGYGFTQRIFLEVEGEVEKEGDSNDTEFTAVALEGKLQLTEQGQYWADIGIKGEYEINTQSGPDAIELKLLLAKDTGQFSHMANLKLEREVGGNSEDETEAGLSWSSRYRYKTHFEPGFELHSSFGPISNGESYDEQDHRLGPVAYGSFAEHFGYDVGYLFGISDSAPDGTFKAILEYETHF